MIEQEKILTTLKEWSDSPVADEILEFVCDLLDISQDKLLEMLED